MSRSLSTLVILFVFLALLLVTQVLNGGLSLLAFEKQQLSTTISAYETIGNHLVSKIERSLKMGKPLNHFIGMKKILSEGARLSGNIDNISVLDLDGNILHSYFPEPFPDKLLVVKSLTEQEKKHVQGGGYHHLLLQLKNGDGLSVGVLCLSFAESRLKEKRQEIFKKIFYVLIVCTVVAGFVLFGGLVVLLPCNTDQRKRYLTLLLFLVLGGGQIFCSLYNIRIFQQDYLELTNRKSQIIGRMLKQEVEFLLLRGLQLDHLVNIDKQLDQSVTEVPELAYLAIIDNRDRILYSGGDRAVHSTDFTEYLEVLHQKKMVGKIEVGLNEEFVEKAVREISFDSLTIVGLSLLVILEMLLFLLAFLFPVQQKVNRGKVEGGSVRTAIFIFIFGASLCHSFIPLYMEQLYRPFLDLSKDVILGLPLAMEMLGGGLVLIPVGRWIDARGWHRPFITGAFFAALGMVGSGLASDQIAFVLFRLVTGIGYGMAWMSAQGFVLQNASSENRARSISGVVAGIFSGVICGNGMGALVAARVGFDRVFFLAAVLMMLSVVFTLCFLRSTMKGVGQVSGGKLKLRSGLVKAFGDSQLLLLFSCSLIPYSIGMVGLLYYVTPLHLTAIGASQSDIGRAIMTFGLCMIFVAPRVSRYAEGFPDKRRFIIGGGVLASMSLLLFGRSNSLWTVVVGVVLFGLSVSMSGAIRNVFALELPVAKKIGDSQLIGIYRSVDKLGQSLGAVIPAMLITLFGLQSAMTVLGGIYLLLTLFLAMRLQFYGSKI